MPISILGILEFRVEFSFGHWFPITLDEDEVYLRQVLERKWGWVKRGP